MVLVDSAVYEGGRRQSTPESLEDTSVSYTHLTLPTKLAV